MSRTRFFGAAALTNAVFAQLFSLLPRLSLAHGYRFLSEAGAVLECANLNWACELRQRSNAGWGLDYELVSREQRLLQALLQARAAEQRPICGELDALLNEGHLAAVSARALPRSRRYSQVLKSVRAEVGGALEFASERHRVRIGLRLVHQLRSLERRRNSYRVALPGSWPAINGWQFS